MSAIEFVMIKKMTKIRHTAPDWIEKTKKQYITKRPSSYIDKLNSGDIQRNFQAKKIKYLITHDVPENFPHNQLRMP